MSKLKLQQFRITDLQTRVHHSASVAKPPWLSTADMGVKNNHFWLSPRRSIILLTTKSFSSGASFIYQQKLQRGMSIDHSFLCVIEVQQHPFVLNQIPSV